MSERTLKRLSYLVIGAVCLNCLFVLLNMSTINDTNTRIKAIEEANVELQAAVAANARTMERMGK